jgi:hypothetical protein
MSHLKAWEKYRTKMLGSSTFQVVALDEWEQRPRDADGPTVLSVSDHAWWRLCESLTMNSHALEVLALENVGLSPSHLVVLAAGLALERSGTAETAALLHIKKLDLQSNRSLVCHHPVARIWQMNCGSHWGHGAITSQVRSQVRSCHENREETSGLDQVPAKSELGRCSAVDCSAHGLCILLACACGPVISHDMARAGIRSCSRSLRTLASSACVIASWGRRVLPL